MKINDAFPSKFLKGSDVGEGVVLTIRDYNMEEVGMQGKTQTKPILYFREEIKGLVLTKATAGAISELYGEEMDHWIGHKITLYSAPKEIFGEIKPVIHVRAPIVHQSPAIRQPGGSGVPF